MATHNYDQSDGSILTAMSFALSAAATTTRHKATGSSPKATSSPATLGGLAGVSENATQPNESENTSQNRQCTRRQKDVDATYNGPFCEPNDLLIVHPGQSWSGKLLTRLVTISSPN